MGSKTRLASYCTKRANNGVNLVTSRNINTRLARPIIECVENFDLLGITLNQHMNWKTYIRKLNNKISRTFGILNRLKYILSLDIKLLIYNSLILSHLHYGILAWGYEHEKITKLQKKCLRILTLSDYKAHTEPLFKRLKLLKVSDIFYLKQLEFYYNYIHQNLPLYFLYNNYITNQTPHNYDTRQRNTYMHYAKHTFAQKYIRNSITKVINTCPTSIKDKIYTHSFKCFLYIKHQIISSYSENCDIINCYICNQPMNL